jgi:hypothetical protein
LRQARLARGLIGDPDPELRAQSSSVVASGTTLSVLAYRAFEDLAVEPSMVMAAPR